VTPGAGPPYARTVARALVSQVIDDIERLRLGGLTWADYSAAIADVLVNVIPFDAYCCHTVDPGTILFTGSVNRDVGCSGSWLAHHEYVIEDVNKWSFLARSGRIAGATSIDTHGEPGRSTRHRSQEAFGFGDELRVSFVVDGIYWGAAAFLRRDGEPCFTPAEVQLVKTVAPAIGAGLRRALLAQPSPRNDGYTVDHGPGVVVFNEHGEPESISGAAERWIGELIEEPPPSTPTESKAVQAVAARARAIPPDTDPLELTARARVRTRSGAWLLLYGTRLTGDTGRTAVIIHPATPQDVAPVIALSYGLTERECHVAMQCVQGRVTKEIARELSLSPYTVQDHLKSIFDKTGVRSRGELVGQIFLNHYATRWERPPTTTPGLLVHSISPAHSDTP
jgi:DNA-binding CsgD family transcriptional regulator